MQHRWQRYRWLSWLLLPVVGVMLLVLAPWLAQEMRPIRSSALFREARVELGAQENLWQRLHGAALYVRALTRAGELQQASEFVDALPPEVKPAVQHEFILALIAAGEQDRALERAREQVTLGAYRQIWQSHNQLEFLYAYLASELATAGRYDDALQAVQWARQKEGGNMFETAYLAIARRAIEAGQVETAIHALEQAPAYGAVAETLLVVDALLQRGQPAHALNFLNRQMKRLEKKDYDLVELPPALEAAVQHASALARAGRTNDAAQHAEKTLRRYLLTHTQQTIDFDALYTLSVRFTECLPAETMQRMLNRLPTDAYECAETHLRGGYLQGLVNTRRWGALTAARARDSDFEIRGIPSRWITVAGLLQTGKVSEARTLIRKNPEYNRARWVQSQLQSLQQKYPTIPQETLRALERITLQWIAPYEFLDLSFASSLALGIVMSGSERFFGDAAQVIRWTDSANPHITNAPLVFESAYYLGLDDPALDELIRATDPEEIYWVRGVAAVAQAGRLEQAESLLQRAGRLSDSDAATYRAGYAIGLAKRGRYREAVRMARGLPYAGHRIFALANIAAELKKQGM